VQNVSGIKFMVLRVILALLFINMSLGAYDNLVKNESYFQKAIEKSNLNNFGKNRVIAILDTGINDDNSELKGKVIKEYDFTTNSEKAVDTNAHGIKIVLINMREIK